MSISEITIPRDLIFVDVETTGFSAVKDRIIEVGALIIKNGEIVEEYQTLVNPGIELPVQTTEITGIKPEDLEDAPRFDDIVSKLEIMFHSGVFVAHNVDFDYNFIEQEFIRINTPFSLPRLCTVKISRTFYPSFYSHNLDSISKRHKIGIVDRHRALDDVKALWEFWQIVQQEFPQHQVASNLQRLTSPAKPSKVKQARTQLGLI